MNILVYAISNRSGGAYSVLADFYNEVIKKNEKYTDVNWIFLLSTQELDETNNVKILNYPNSIKSWFHRMCFCINTVKVIVKEYNIDAVVSLQNMGIIGCNLPTIISLHNILPAYKCGFDVFDSPKWIIKQKITNASIISSMKKAYKTFVPSEWVKEKFVNEKGVNADSIITLKCQITKIDENIYSNEPLLEKITFFYPATPYPYKNHRIILEACKKLKNDGISEFEVLFTINGNENKTAKKIAEEIKEHQLNINLVGMLPRSRVLNLYRHSVLLFPSKIEMDAMPLIESAQVGGFILAANLPYARENLNNYAGKEYFDVEECEQLYSIMKNLILNGVPEGVEQMAITNTENDLSRIDKIVELVEKLS